MNPKVTEEMVERAAAEIYHCYVAEAVRGQAPMAYVRRWRELDEPFRAMWRRCAREGLDAALGGDESADNARDD